MPSVGENLMLWNYRYGWPRGGDEWSEPWGSPEAQWQATILPRLEGFLPARTIVEIAPGFGRWTRFLAGQCERLIVVDVSPKCIGACRERFKDQQHLVFKVNDGFTLPEVEDHSVDMVFSFDSLVHVEPDVVSSYLKESSRVLSPQGGGFFHHSNLGQYAAELPNQLTAGEFWRSRKMSAETFRSCCEEAGLVCVKQETVNWLETGRLLDCFSWFRRSSDALSSPPAISNWAFMEEAHRKDH
jgi:ubiquinone/menaquinone biosynthesis C-methylase UbiE